LASAVVCAGATVDLTPTVTFDGSVYTYSYAASLSGAVGGEGAYQITLELLAGLVADPLTIGSPANWTAVADFTAGSITWVSNSYADDVFGAVLSGFSFMSTMPPGLVSYAVELENSSSTPAGTLLGQVQGPAFAPVGVPEPGTWAGALAGLAALGWFRKRKACLPLLAAAGIWAAPNPVVRVQGAPAWEPGISVRAGRPAVLDGSASTGAGVLGYVWQQVDGPNTLRWSSRVTAQPVVSGLVFGTYRVRLTVSDTTGSASADLTFGSVASDDAGVVTLPSREAALVFGPLIRFGASPWPWMDERHKSLSDALRSAMASHPGFQGLDWRTALPGTVTVTNGSAVVTGAGTQFQTDFCGGVGNTAPAVLSPMPFAPQPRQIVLWYPVPGGGTGRRNHPISRCDSQTQITLAQPFMTLPGQRTGVSYSKLECPNCWGGESSNINYYDTVLALYSLYYRSGRTEYLAAARELAASWWRSPSMDEGRVYDFSLASAPWTSFPRKASLPGLMWWAWESGQTGAWNGLYLGLDWFASLMNASGWDVRERGGILGALALAARLAPDASRRAAYAAAVQSNLGGYWQPAQQAAGHYLVANELAGGLAAVTNGSDVVTLTGTTVTAAQLADTNFWVAYDAAGTTGDAESYSNPQWISPTSFRLPRPYAGPTDASRHFQLSILAGPGVQPFFHSIAARNLDLAWRATSDPRARQSADRLVNWLRTQGQQNSTKGFYYGRLYTNCEPIRDAIPRCSYDAAQAEQTSESRYLTGIFAGWSASFLETGSAALLTDGDRLVGAALGKMGGPQSDGGYVQNLDWAGPSMWFKDLGFFFGHSSVVTWAAARTGTATARLNGR
jgi:hypothetical protein